MLISKKKEVLKAGLDTEITPIEANNLREEIYGLLEALGEEPDGNKTDQLKRAIVQTINNVVSSGGGTTSTSELEKITEGGNTGWRLLGRDSNNYGNIGSNAIDLSINTVSSTSRGATGGYSFASGRNTTASGFYSHAEGYKTIASGRNSHAEGSETEASGHASHAEGYYTTASGYASHTEGTYSTASNFDSHAEGSDTYAAGSSSHAEGNQTTASGSASHAEGYKAIANGIASHSEGYNVTANNDYMHAEGVYNTETQPATLISVVGIGVSEFNRKNGFEVHTTGEVIAPELTNAIIDGFAVGTVLATRDYVNIGSRDFVNLTDTTTASVPNNSIFMETNILKFKNNTGVVNTITLT